jgi:hypothetical protein
VVHDRDSYEPQKNHLAGGPINVRRHIDLTQGLEIPMAVTFVERDEFKAGWRSALKWDPPGH